MFFVNLIFQSYFCSIMNKAILRLALPNIVSNITVPLLGLVDISIVGHLESENYIGAIARASAIFNLIYWNFSFLRMGTSGFTAQFFGAENKPEQVNILIRSLFIALIGSIFIISCQSLILKLGYFIFDTNQEIKVFVAEYFRIYIWAAPAILGMYAFNGWFVGMQDAKTPMFIAIGINVVNIALSLLFVYVLGMKIDGVALASLCAQYVGLISAFIICFFKHANLRIYINLSILKNITEFVPLFRVNTDILIRTLALVAVTTFFMSASSHDNTSYIIDVNALLMQLFILFSYFMDGFAYAAEALTGKLIGAQKRNELKSLIRHLFKWGFAIVLLFTITYSLFLDKILNILTDKQNLIDLALHYKFWVYIIPVAGFSAFLWDGIFIGATASRQMRNSMLIAAVSFFSIYFVFYYFFTSFFDRNSNNILWFVFILYLSMRGLTQMVMARNILK